MLTFLGVREHAQASFGEITSCSESVPEARLLEEAGLLLAPGSAFGTDSQRMRIGFRLGSDLSRSWLLIKNSIARRKDSPAASLNTVASRSAAWSLAVRLSRH